MNVLSLRVSLNGVSKNQINNLFSLISTLETPINIFRTSHTKFAYSRVDLILTGLFPLYFLRKFDQIFSSTIGITLDISNYPQALINIKKYATLKWELDTITALLGICIFPRDVMKQILGIKSDLEFLKLLLMTPASSYLKNYLITKPKGLLSFSKDRLHLLLSNHSIDFITHWVTKVVHTGEVEKKWVNGSSGELDEITRLKLDISPKFFGNLEKWRKIAQKYTIDDFDLVYSKMFKLISREETKI